MTTLQHIQHMAVGYEGGQVIFDDPLHVKSSPHRLVFTAYGIWSGNNGVFVLDGDGEWHGPLLENQVNADLMINSIYQRLKYYEWKLSCKLTG